MKERDPYGDRYQEGDPGVDRVVTSLDDHYSLIRLKDGSYLFTDNDYSRSEEGYLVASGSIGLGLTFMRDVMADSFSKSNQFLVQIFEYLMTEFISRTEDRPEGLR